MARVAALANRSPTATIPSKARPIFWPLGGPRINKAYSIFFRPPRHAGPSVNSKAGTHHTTTCRYAALHTVNHGRVRPDRIIYRGRVAAGAGVVVLPYL